MDRRQFRKARAARLCLCALSVGVVSLIGVPAMAAEPDEEVDEDAAPGEDDEKAPERVANPEGEEPEESDDKRKKRTKKVKGEKSAKTKKAEKAEKAESPSDALLPPERTSGKRARKYELKKPWIKRWAPERDMIDAGFYIGAIFVPTNHGLYDAGEGPRPTLRRAAFDGGFRLAYMPLSFLGVGLEVDGATTRSPSEAFGANLTTFRMHVIAQLPYRITPTFVIGGGFVALRSSRDILNALDGAFHYGLGLKIHATQWIAARIDGRHIVVGGDGGARAASYGELLFGVDVTIRLRRLIKPRKIDSDGDGYYDRDDACPREAGDGDDGCPTNRDGDNDGVPDRNDKCPKEYGDDPQGCPIPDKDGDGILDSKDECWEQPETFNGFEDENGCPDEQPEKLKKLTGVIGGITFDSGQATIRTSSRRVLEGVIATLKEYDKVRVEIIGHTDDQGSREGNVALSAARAEAVKKYLVSKGIDESRITTKGVGPDQPIADNKTKAGRAKNRRIEFKAE